MVRKFGGLEVGVLTRGLEGEADFVGSFLETLGVDAGAEADFDSGAQGLGVGDCGDTGVIDLALPLLAPTKFGIVTLTKVSLSRRYLAAISRATPPEVALGSKLAFPAAFTLVSYNKTPE